MRRWMALDGPHLRRVRRLEVSLIRHPWFIPNALTTLTSNTEASEPQIFHPEAKLSHR